MKTLIFSDTHLTDRFDEKKYNFLKKIISSADRVVINGDFWDGYLTTFDRFINSPWKKLFPLLKTKKTVYLYGNHDTKTMVDKKARLFSDIQTNQYIIKHKNTRFVFEHGERLIPAEDKFFKSKRVLYFLTLLIQVELWLQAKKLFNRNFYHNWRLQKLKTKFFDTNTYLICGHTHFFDINNDIKYANSGIILYGLAQYLTIENGKVIAHEERY